ncbi:DUF5058 family protein [Clostridioides difficile]|uniref:DUF5058 family protein n=1 Tax=Clostridioides difficile TaxID=1496 RepID=UPI001F223F3C|nr:DUF5058 family protein [Clostridioides difficile]
MKFQDMINSPGLWLVSSFLVIISVVHAIVFMKEALKEASNLGIERKGIKAAIRSARVTAIGPSLSTVITLLSLVAVIGAPTTLIRLSAVGAARTELGVITLTSNLSGVAVGSC